MRRAQLEGMLAGAGCIAASEEADELLAAAGADDARLDALVERRVRGEPLAWIVGSTRFCGREVRVDPGVYVPRWQSEPLARRALERLGATGTAIELCCGAGAIAHFLAAMRPGARIVATEIDPTAAACARSNGVEVHVGDLFEPLPDGLSADVVVAVPPYVPSDELRLLPRDTLAFEDPIAYDGGEAGLAVLTRIVERAPDRLRPGATLLLELGGDQGELLAERALRLGYGPGELWRDEDGDVRGIELRLRPR